MTEDELIGARGSSRPARSLVFARNANRRNNDTFQVASFIGSQSSQLRENDSSDEILGIL